MRIPKLRGFKNRDKIDYEIVNVGDIDARVEAGAFARAGATPKKGEQLTINADVLRAVGLVRNIKKPLKILGAGELSGGPLFVVADAFTKSATEKIEKAGGAVSVLEVPAETRPALGADGEPVVREARVARTADGRAAAGRKVDARARRDADTAEAEAEAKASKAGKASKASAKAQADEATVAEPADAEAATVAEPETEAPAKAKPARKAKAAETAEPADTADTESAEEPADAPDAVADASDAEPVTGDDTESDSAVPGDDA